MVDILESQCTVLNPKPESFSKTIPTQCGTVSSKETTENRVESSANDAYLRLIDFCITQL